jgi:hypothetical protein
MPKEEVAVAVAVRQSGTNALSGKRRVLSIRPRNTGSKDMTTYIVYLKGVPAPVVVESFTRPDYHSDSRFVKIGENVFAQDALIAVMVSDEE